MIEVSSSVSPRVSHMDRIRLLLSIVACLLPLCAAANDAVMLSKADLGKEFLLQTSYEQMGTWQDFMTSRSRLVTFLRRGDTLRMVEKQGHAIHPYRVLATMPIRHETSHSLLVDVNAGFDRIFKQEDRTGEDYYGRLDRDYSSYIPLTDRKLLDVYRSGPLLVIRQSALDEEGRRIVVHYYLSRYRRNPDFEPFELESLDHFGFYETYPRRQSGRAVLYAMKFDAHEPIVFALSARIPARHRPAVRDGIAYWNTALGVQLLEAIDAPEGVTAPDPNYNVIEWVTEKNHSSTSHIQSDPLTGEILHASIFVRSESVMLGSHAARNDRLRYVVAHEVGHALGLRHNFADGPVSTVMNYFSFEQSVQIGNDIIESGNTALEYDRNVIRHVYLGEPLDVDELPPFCTDGQAGCKALPRFSAGSPSR